MQLIESFQTEHLAAQRFRPQDYKDLCGMHQDIRVMATLGGVRSDATTREFLQTGIEHWDTHGFGLWIFRAPDDGQFVGRGGLKYVHIGGNEEIELGYSLLPEYWGQGLATEVARACLSIGLDQLGLDNIVCFTLTTNHASERVMQKVGFKFERRIEYDGQPTLLYRYRVPSTEI